MFKLYYLHTIYNKSDMLRSVLLILRELQKIEKPL